MAIAFGRVTPNGDGTDPLSGTIAVSIVVNAGETVTVDVYSGGATLATVTGISGGGAYASRVVATNGTCRAAKWSTAAGAATAATTVTISYTGAADTIIAIVRSDTGALGLGVTNSAVGSTANPSLATTTQDNNNWILGGLATLHGIDATAGTGNLRSTWGQSPSTGSVQGDLASVDNTSASPGSVTTSVTQPAATWAATALELRTVAGAVAVTTSPLPPTFPRATGPMNPLWRAAKNLAALSTFLAVAAGVNADAAGTLTLSGASSATVTDSVAAAGTLVPSGAADASVTDAAGAAGTLSLVGAAATTVSEQAAAAGTLVPSGAATSGLADAIDAAGSLGALVGTAAAGATATASASGTIGPLTGASTLGAIDGATAAGTLALTESSASAATDGATGAGTLALTGTAATTDVVQATSSGTIVPGGSGTDGVTVQSDAAGTLALIGSSTVITGNVVTADAAGTLTVAGSATAGIADAATADAIAGSGQLALGSASTVTGALAAIGASTLAPSGAASIGLPDVASAASTLALAGGSDATVFPQGGVVADALGTLDIVGSATGTVSPFPVTLLIADDGGATPRYPHGTHARDKVPAKAREKTRSTTPSLAVVIAGARGILVPRAGSQVTERVAGAGDGLLSLAGTGHAETGLSALEELALLVLA